MTIRPKEKGYTIEFKSNVEETEDRLVIRPYLQEDVGNHNHDFFELAYVTGGRALHILEDGNPVEVGRGDYLIVDYGTRHRYSKSREFRLINCLFLPEIIDGSLQGARAFKDILKVSFMRYYQKFPDILPTNRIFHDEDGKILKLLEQVEEEYRKKEAGYVELFRCKLQEIVILTLRKLMAEAGERMELYSPPVTRMIQYIDRNWRERGYLQKFCRANHYSPHYISRKFKGEVGVTIHEYVQRRRIEKGCEYLTQNQLSIEEVAEQIGYEDVKFFRKLFRNTMGMTPRQYRNLMKDMRKGVL